MTRSRREFLTDVSSGMLIAGLGASLAGDLGVTSAFANEGTESLDFGDLRPLVGLLQETPVEKLLPILVNKLNSGDVNPQRLVAAAALANAETFGGVDYVGFHTEMALLPAYQMSAEMPTERQALPILKVLYRNTDRIQESGQAKTKSLQPVLPVDVADTVPGGKELRDATRAGDMELSERIFAAQSNGALRAAYNRLLWSVQDAEDVHRFVLAHRAYALIDVVGAQHAHTMLRQCVRYCVDVEQRMKQRNYAEPPTRQLVPKLLDQYQLLGGSAETREPDDAWFNETAQFIHQHNGEQSMDAIAAAIHEGIPLEAIGQAISLAANQLVLRQVQGHKGLARCHGDAPGVHSSDATNAWRNMARAANRRNAVVGLLVAAYHVGQYKNHTEAEPYLHDEYREIVKAKDADSLLAEAEAAIRANEQGRAAAAIQIYGEQGHDARSVFDLMLRYTISEDGRLHGEKYYRTVTEEFATTRPAFRWRQLVGLARVTASAYGFNREDEPGHRAPGYEEACRLLEIDV